MFGFWLFSSPPCKFNFKKFFNVVIMQSNQGRWFMVQNCEHVFFRDENCSRSVAEQMNRKIHEKKQCFDQVLRFHCLKILYFQNFQIKKLSCQKKRSSSFFFNNNRKVAFVRKSNCSLRTAFFYVKILHPFARCLRVKQHYPAQKNNQKKLHVVLKQGHDSRDELYSSCCKGPFPVDEWS